MWKFIILFVASSLFISVGPSSAQSIEDTVVYLFTGVEDKDIPISGSYGSDSKIYMKRNGVNEVLIDVSAKIDGNYKKFYHSINFTEINKCEISMERHFNYSGSRPGENDDFVIYFKIDMSKVNDINFVDDKYVSFSGSRFECVVNPNIYQEMCKKYDLRSSFQTDNNADRSRLKKAFSYYREKFCNGSAF